MFLCAFEAVEALEVHVIDHGGHLMPVILVYGTARSAHTLPLVTHVFS